MLVAAATVACSPPEKTGAESAGGDSGQLSLGVVGGTKDMLYPYAPQQTISEEVLWQNTLDQLTMYAPDGSVKYALAESMTPNKKLDVWTVKLRPGVKLHSGKTFGADDVIFSVRSLLTEKGYPFAANLDFVDPDGQKKVDDLTVEFHLKRPFGPFAAAWAYSSFKMIGASSTKDKVDGTGPFTVKSFSPGAQAVLERYDAYWGTKPGFGTLNVRFFQDQTAITNALRGGQIDVAPSVPFSDAKTLEAGGVKVLKSDSMNVLSLDMRTDIAPFKDVRVREAMKLIVDREQIASNAFGGFAKPANDYNGVSSSCPAPDVAQRAQDIAKAKQLLAEAGQSDLKVELVTDGAFPGMMELAQLFAQQASEAGVTVTVRKMDVATLLNKWLEWPFIINITSSPMINAITDHLLPKGGNNAAHFDDPEFNKIAADLFASSDADQQCGDIQKLQKIQWERGGSIIAVTSQDLTPYTTRVRGLQPDVLGRSAYLYGGVSVG
ncbi:ABC transporter substrate-binding protein [Sphaerisporangium krabiense]|uniref:Peptide/nickel transport system substrate-binding protein n=1 Tax=Sphaerisporangium krabiense TaxID=763782 RepID=A0A7W8Z1U2_9ACTN|nr:ABC transporter substrate-binding protein [Sphaerisporangium krabiense]MBB5625908.1 peptide/nickel transport system substrate-binding protein [Sphaerisporangium krabiense]